LKNDIPTSEVLARLVANAPADTVSLGWIAAQLRGRSFGMLTLVMAVAGLAPGIASVSGFLLAIPAIQLLLGREAFTLPKSLAARSISTPKFARICGWITPVLRWTETFSRPRLQMPHGITNRIVGAIELALAVTITFPFPFAYIVPTLAIIVISLAYLEEDGVLLWVGFAAAFAALCFGAALVWAAVRAAGLLINL
jgi:hypothetical protein